MRSLTIGAGEIGKSLHQVLLPHHESHIRDVEDYILDAVDVLNICYPPGPKFLTTTRKYIKQYKPRLTIIHSTVPVGTSRKLGAVHSPIHGKHPNLSEGILTFTKYVGGELHEDVELAVSFLTSAGIKTQVVSSPEASELSKILCTSYYGWNLVFMKEVVEICKDYKVPFNEVYTEWNYHYNDGYSKLDSPQFVRPILFPEPGGLKGHCILENATLLKDSGIDFLPDVILKAGKSLETVKEPKPYMNKTWFYCEHWGKKRTLKDIGAEFGVTGENIQQIAKRRGWRIRNNKWDEKTIQNVLKLHKEGKTFKEISEVLETKDYGSLRNLVYHRLKLKSNYSPGEETKKLENRKKISAKLQGIKPAEWVGFKESKNAIIRKSERMKKWREAVFRRDEYKCVKCKKTGYIEADHIKEFAKYPKLRLDVSNGQTLCKPCHKEKTFPKKN